MIGRTWWIQVLATLVCFAACSPAPQSDLADVALELRALRLQLRAAGTAGPDVATGVADAMAPLREVLQGIVATQREQERRQLQLAQEVQRWGHLVAESLAPAKGEEARAVAARLQELEQKLKEQDERHQKVEELVGTALDRASEQLDRFLRRLPVPAAVEAAPEATEGGAAPVVPTQGPVAPLPRQSRVWLWVGLLGLSLAASAVLFGLAWRMRGAAARPGGAARDVESGEPLGIRAKPSTSEVPAEPGADRLWAAAALLGEAVETLRARQAAAQERPSVPPADTLDDLSIEDLFVVDGLDEASLSGELEPGKIHDASPAAAPALPKAADAASSEPSSKRAVPEEVTVRMRPKDGKAAQHDLLRILHGDPRILQRPAPRLEAQGGQLVVRFALLPGLPAGERSVLEQRLRDSVA